MNRISRDLAIGVALVIAAACMVWWPHIRNEWFVFTGVRYEAGAYYGFWSGFAGGTRAIELPVLGGLLYWHSTCQHSIWCIRLGKYPAAGGVFKLCHLHHPDLVGERPHHDLIRRLHHEHKQRQA